MPELPEVETTVERIKSSLINQTVAEVEISENENGKRLKVPFDLERYIEDNEILGVERQGKYSLIEFEHGTVMFDLRVSGRLLFYDDSPPCCRHTRVDFKLEGGSFLRLVDARSIAQIYWITADERIKLKLKNESDDGTTKSEGFNKLKNLGPDPLSNKFDGDCLQKICMDSNARIKVTTRPF